MEASELVQAIYRIAHRIEEIRIPGEKYPFNNTEMQMMREIVSAKEEGRRVISSALARTLGVTRSAVSQMVNKLESCDVVRRVPDKKDRKIAYIELSGRALELYEELKGRVGRIMDLVIARLGSKKVEKFIQSANEFVDVFGEAVRTAE